MDAQPIAGLSKGEKLDDNWIKQIETSLIPDGFDHLERSAPAFIRKWGEKLQDKDLLFMVLVNSGLARQETVQLRLPNKVITDSCNEQIVYERARFVDVILEKDPSLQNTIVIVADVKNVRGADHVKEIGSKGLSAADVLLSDVAENLTNKCYQLNTYFQSKQIDIEVYCCRYGGDEFGIAIRGNKDTQLLRTVFNFLENSKDGIGSLKACFKITEGVVLENQSVELKKSLEDSVIPMPESGDRKETYKLFFKHGLILTPDELDLVMDNQQILEEYKKKLTQRKPIELFKRNGESRSAEEIIEEVVKRHPELVETANKVSQLNPLDKLEFAWDLADFADKYLTDRLLGKKVGNYFDFVQHSIGGQHDQFLIIDLKGIKEINDGASVAAGDLAIMAMFEALEKKLGVGYEQYYSIYRRGSTFVVAAKNGVSIPAGMEINSLFVKQQTMEFDFHQSKLEAVVVAGQFVPPISGVFEVENKYKIFGDAYGEAAHRIEDNYNLRILNRLKTRSLDDFDDSVLGSSMNLDELLKQDNLDTKFILGEKRFDERVSSLIGTINQLCKNPRLDEVLDYTWLDSVRRNLEARLREHRTERMKSFQ